jgi:hypothetical protein
VGAAPALRLRVGRGLVNAHQYSLSSFPSMLRRCRREHTSQ